MSILHGDGFDHYGSTAALLLTGPYAAASGVSLSATNPHTGLRNARISPSGNDQGLRRVLGANLVESGGAYHFWTPELPSDSESFTMWQWRDGDNVRLFSLVCSSAGEIIAKLGGSGGVEIDRSDPCVVTGSYQHFECNAVIADSGGSVEVRINGQTVLNLTGIDSKASPDDSGDPDYGDPAQYFIGASGVAITGFPDYVDIDNLIARDANGTENNTFVGEKKCYTIFPNADTATEDWVPASGVDSFAMINNNPPVDGSEFLTADAAAEVTVVGLEDLPAEVVSIAALYVVSRLWKSDAGTATIQASIVSGASEEGGTDRAISQAPTYYGDVFEVDPDTDFAWTPAGVNAAQYKVERTT